MALTIPTAVEAKVGTCEGPITFGATISATGRNSTIADRWVKMAEVFEAELNKKGGIFIEDCNKLLSIKIVSYDNQRNREHRSCAL